MKFAKALFFICVIGIITSRAVSKAEAEYTAATNALKLEVGYKEMFQNTFENKMPPFGNQEVQVVMEDSKASATLDLNMMENNSFNSGIPFYFKAASSEKVVSKNMVKLNDKTWYIPFNTISKACSFDSNIDSSVPLYLTCFLANKNGTPVLKINFTGFSAHSRRDQMAVSIIANGFSEKQEARKSFISQKFKDVGNAIWYSMTYQEEITGIKKSDADILAAKKASIEKLKKQIAELTAKLALLQKQKVTLSGELQTTQTKKTETTVTKTKKITYKLSLEATIKTLESSVSTQAQIEGLQATIDKALKQLKYWLQGAVYHRVINAEEKTGLEGLKDNNSGFDAKVNDYFFPQ